MDNLEVELMKADMANLAKHMGEQIAGIYEILGQQLQAYQILSNHVTELKDKLDKLTIGES